MPVRSKWQSLPTEQINPATLAIDKLSPADIVEGMLNEDRKMLAAVQREKDRIAVGVEIITQALRKNGRIIFVGAGTSGRLGVLESAEMPPTFGTDPSMVQAIMAGGQNALMRPREGIEDNYEEGARSIMRLKPSKRDVVVGVSASGMKQFVRGDRHAGVGAHLPGRPGAPAPGPRFREGRHRRGRRTTVERAPEGRLNPGAGVGRTLRVRHDRRDQARLTDDKARPASVLRQD